MRYLYALLFLAATFSSIDSAQAQWWPGDYMQQSLDVCFDQADWYLEHTEYGFGPQISLVGSFMSVGERYPMLKYFDRDTDYVIIAAGDMDANDVDIRVRDASGRLLAEDASYNREALVEFNAGRGGQLAIEVELHSAEADSFVSFVVLQAGGWYIPRHDFNIAANEMLGMCQDADAAVRREGKSLMLNDEYNQACLFGGLMGGEEGTTLTNLQFGQGEVVILAAGDSDVEDIDLVLQDQRGRELTADRLADPHPVLTYPTSARQRYEVELTSAAATGTVPTFCIVGFLQVE